MITLAPTTASRLVADRGSHSPRLIVSIFVYAFEKPVRWLCYTLQTLCNTINIHLTFCGSMIESSPYLVRTVFFALALEGSRLLSNATAVSARTTHTIVSGYLYSDTMHIMTYRESLMDVFSL